MSQENSPATRNLLESFESSGALNDEKKVLAFCCACCRLIWVKLPKIAQDALVVSEQYIKGSANVNDLVSARVSLWNYLGNESMRFDLPHISATRAVICCLYKIKTMDEAFSSAAYAMDFCNNVEDKDSEHFEILMKIFGNSNN